MYRSIQMVAGAGGYTAPRAEQSARSFVTVRRVPRQLFRLERLLLDDSGPMLRVRRGRRVGPHEWRCRTDGRQTGPHERLQSRRRVGQEGLQANTGLEGEARTAQAHRRPAQPQAGQAQLSVHQDVSSLWQHDHTQSGPRRLAHLRLQPQLAQSVQQRRLHESRAQIRM